MDYVEVFFFTLASEVCWARYNIASSERRALVGALWSAAIVLCGTLGTQVWLSNHWTILSSLAAALVGTYYGIRWAPVVSDQILIAILSALFYSVLRVVFNKASVEGNATVAGITLGGQIALGGVIVMGYAENHWLGIVSAVSAGIGAWFTTSMIRSKKP